MAVASSDRVDRLEASMRGTRFATLLPAFVSAVALTILPTSCTEPDDGLRLSDRDSLTLEIVPGITPPLGNAATIRSASVDGDYLALEVQFGGGCRTHLFGMYNDGLEGLSNPPYYTLYLAHDARGDLCEALLTRQLAVDLRPLQAIASPGGVLLLRLVEPDGTPVSLDELRYEY
jgi:hypothetical protein